MIGLLGLFFIVAGWQLKESPIISVIFIILGIVIVIYSTGLEPTGFAYG